MTRRSLLAAIASLALPRSAWATLYVTSSTERLVALTHVIPLARVSAASAEWVGGRIMTRAVLDPEESFKGVAEPGLNLLLPGGRIDGIGMRVAGYPEVTAGERAIWLLSRPAGSTACRLVGGIVGRLTVTRLAGGEDVVHLLDPAANRISRTPLSTFRDALRDTVRRTERSTGAP